MNKKLLFVLFLCLVTPVTVYASAGVTMKVETKTENGVELEIGQIVDFVITITNTTDMPAPVEVSHSREPWVRSLTVAPGDARQLTMQYKIGADVKGGSAVDITFRGLSGKQQIEQTQEITTWNFTITPQLNLVVVPAFREAQSLLPTRLVVYDLTLHNTGNVDIRNVELTQSLDLGANLVIGDLLIGGTRNAQVRYNIPAGLETGYEVKNTITVWSDNATSASYEFSFLIGGRGAIIKETSSPEIRPPAQNNYAIQNPAILGPALEPDNTVSTKASNGSIVIDGSTVGDSYTGDSYTGGDLTKGDVNEAGDGRPSVGNVVPIIEYPSETSFTKDTSTISNESIASESSPNANDNARAIEDNVQSTVTPPQTSDDGEFFMIPAVLLLSVIVLLCLVIVRRVLYSR